MEIWNPITNYEEHYQVSNKGRVRSLDRKVKNGTGYRHCGGKVLSPRDNSSGYKFVTLYDAETKRSVTRYIHALVAEAFLGFGRGSKKTIDHIDEDKGNNVADNLRIISQSDNSKRWRGKIKGWDTTKISIEQARLMRYYYSTSEKVTYKQLSGVFKLSNRGVQKCIKRETWKNVI